MNQVATTERVTFTVTGLGLTGEEWVTRLEAGGHKMSDWTHDTLMQPDYDQNHRLEAGKEYKVTLVFGKEISKDQERKNSNLKEFACREIGDQSVKGLKGELALLIREKFSNAELKAMDIYYIAVLHEPIVGSSDNVNVLSSFRCEDEYESDVESYVPSECDVLDIDWGVLGAFAFFASP